MVEEYASVRHPSPGVQLAKALGTGYSDFAHQGVCGSGSGQMALGGGALLTSSKVSGMV